MIRNEPSELAESPVAMLLNSTTSCNKLPQKILHMETLIIRSLKQLNKKSESYLRYCLRGILIL